MLYLRRIFFTLLLLCSSFSYTLCYAESTPFIAFDSAGVLQAVLTHVVLLQHGEIEKIYDELSTGYFKSTTPIDQFIDHLPALPPIVDERQVVLENITFGGQAALYQGYLLDLQAEPVMQLSYLLLYEQGRWRVHGLKMTPYSITPLPSAKNVTKQPLDRPYLRNI